MNDTTSPPPLEQAHEAVTTAGSAVLDALDPAGTNAARARAYTARSVAWRQLADASPLDLHPHYYAALLLAAQHDADSAKCWKEL